MLVFICILFVLNMALACDDTNKFWWGNMLAGFYMAAIMANTVGV